MTGVQTCALPIYIKAQDYLIWKIIVNGPHVPTKIVEEQEISKQETEWDENDDNMRWIRERGQYLMGLKINAIERLI